LLPAVTAWIGLFSVLHAVLTIFFSLAPLLRNLIPEDLLQNATQFLRNLRNSTLLRQFTEALNRSRGEYIATFWIIQNHRVQSCEYNKQDPYWGTSSMAPTQLPLPFALLVLL
jgi:hypothetical protein